MIVGKRYTRDVSKLNKELFDKARVIFAKTSDDGFWHMGWEQVGNYIDWLEENYKIEKKGKEGKQ